MPTFVDNSKRKHNEPKYNPFHFAFNGFHVRRDLPHIRACYHVMQLWHVFLVIYTIGAFAVYLMHRYLNILPHLMERAQVENYFELYCHLFDYIAYPSLIFLIGALLWVNARYKFKEYDYTNIRPSYMPRHKITNLYLLGYLGLVIVWLIPLCYPSLISWAFYKEQYEGYFIAQFNNTDFIALGAFVMALFYHMAFHVCFAMLLFVLSGIHHKDQKRKTRRPENNIYE